MCDFLILSGKYALQYNVPKETETRYFRSLIKSTYYVHVLCYQML